MHCSTVLYKTYPANTSAAIAGRTIGNVSKPAEITNRIMPVCNMTNTTRSSKTIDIVIFDLALPAHTNKTKPAKKTQTTCHPKKPKEPRSLCPSSCPTKHLARGLTMPWKCRLQVRFHRRTANMPPPANRTNLASVDTLPRSHGVPKVWPEVVNRWNARRETRNRCLTNRRTLPSWGACRSR